MKNLNPDQKVVFSVEKLLRSGYEHEEGAIIPKEKEVVTIGKQVDGPYYTLKEYPFFKNGDKQAFHALSLHPFDEFNKEETEKITTGIEGFFEKQEQKIPVFKNLFN